MRDSFIAYIAKVDGRSVEEVEEVFKGKDDRFIELMIIKLLEVNK